MVLCSFHKRPDEVRKHGSFSKWIEQNGKHKGCVLSKGQHRPREVDTKQIVRATQTRSRTAVWRWTELGTRTKVRTGKEMTERFLEAGSQLTKLMS
jgi:hypothetical protein